MSLYAGIDLGTSGVKIVLVDEAEEVVASAGRRLEVSRPRPGWSEQDPESWWRACLEAMDDLAAADRGMMGRVAGIGLSGQMLAALLIDRADRPLRPAILWNDERAILESGELLARVPDIGRRTTSDPDPGITAPKLLWLRRHEPEVMDAADLLLLPKDYLRLKLTGERASEPSDAGGTQLLENATRRWASDLCAAAGWPSEKLPRLIESWESGGGLLPALAARWGMRTGLPVAGGAGDNMACSLGVGVAGPGRAALTIGTSGVLCIAGERFRPAPEKALLTNPHAAPDLFVSQGVVMSATATLDWLARLTGQDASALAQGAEALFEAGESDQAPLMLPCLNGIRTPDRIPDARGMIRGLSLSTTPQDLAFAVIEGLTFQFKDCLDAMAGVGIEADEIQLVGGGSKSPLWCRLTASLLGRPATLARFRDVAASVGAARLARCAAGDADARRYLATPPAAQAQIEPERAVAERLLPRFERYRAAYAHDVLTARR